LGNDSKRQEQGQEGTEASQPIKGVLVTSHWPQGHATEQAPRICPVDAGKWRMNPPAPVLYWLSVATLPNCSCQSAEWLPQFERKP